MREGQNHDTSSATGIRSLSLLRSFGMSSCYSNSSEFEGHECVNGLVFGGLCPGISGTEQGLVVDRGQQLQLGIVS